jgi:hypothetical protein
MIPFIDPIALFGLDAAGSAAKAAELKVDAGTGRAFRRPPAAGVVGVLEGV